MVRSAASCCDESFSNRTPASWCESSVCPCSVPDTQCTTSMILISYQMAFSFDGSFSTPVGEEWETAWNNHVKNYKNPCRDQTQNESTCYKSSKFIQSMNNDKHNPQYHTWSEDHFILCKSEHFVKDPQTFIHLKKFDSSSFADAVSSKESYRGISFDDELFERHLSVNGERGRPCKVLSVNDDKTFDMAVPLTGGEKRHFKIGAEVKVLSLATLNATDIVYWNKPYTTDMFATSAFRHTIGIPDEIFPTLWKDEE